MPSKVMAPRQIKDRKGTRRKCPKMAPPSSPTSILPYYHYLPFSSFSTITLPSSSPHSSPFIISSHLLYLFLFANCANVAIGGMSSHTSNIHQNRPSSPSPFSSFSSSASSSSSQSFSNASTPFPLFKSSVANSSHTHSLHSIASTTPPNSSPTGSSSSSISNLHLATSPSTLASVPTEPDTSYTSYAPFDLLSSESTRQTTTRHYTNESLHSAGSAQGTMTSNNVPKGIPFSGGGSLLHDPSLLNNEHSYQGLVQTADHFSNPFFMNAHVVDPLLDQANPSLSGDALSGVHPILMDFMHMKAPADASLLYGTPNTPSYFDFDFSNPAHENFAAIDSAEDYESTAPGLNSLSHSAPGGSGSSSKRPVAQNMLFIGKSPKYQSYYTPFKVNTINVYAKYLTHGGKGGGKGCSRKGKSDILALTDVHSAINDAAKTVDWYQRTVRDNALATKRRSPYIPSGVLDSKMFEYASDSLRKRKCFNKMDIITILPKIDVSLMVSRYAMPACKGPAAIYCDSKAKYRTIDGTCNNLKMKSWGKSFTCHRRLLPPDYADGISAPRIAYSGGKLPNARELSVLLFPDITVMDHKLSSMTMAFGQFIVHDITRTLPTSNDIKCCPSKTAKHPECFAIDITRYDDVLYKAFNQTCINFVRTITCNPCSLGPREQQNQATHIFDMSHQYGLRLNDSLALRTRRGGKLRSSSTSTYPKEELPPKMTREEPGCNVRPVPPRFKCFDSADGVRASQHPGLQAIHVAFHRRHNQHTDRLAKVNPHWDDEKLYQEARRITIAEQTKMVYGEYLPAIFGKKLVKHFRLNLNYKGYSKYDGKLNPSTIQEFIIAAGRFGHSQVNDQFRVLFKEKKNSYSYSLKDNFFETTIISLGHSGGVLKGMVSDSTEAVDPYFVDTIKNSLYHARKEKLGRDLPAFNIQRGREHGIPGYVFYLDFCFGFKVKRWYDLATFIPKKQLKKIQNLYKHWKDVDLFVGGISERLIAGAAFGPTFACINGIQFYNFKYGDRFYFEHGYQAGSFTPAQLENIKKTSTLSQLICKTHPEISHMPENAFIRGHGHRPCDSFPELNYHLWADTKYSKSPPVYKGKGVTMYRGKGGQHGAYRKGVKYGYGKGPKVHSGAKTYGTSSGNYKVDKPVDEHWTHGNTEYEEEGPIDDNDDTDDTAPRSKFFTGHAPRPYHGSMGPHPPPGHPFGPPLSHHPAFPPPHLPAMGPPTIVSPYPPHQTPPFPPPPFPPHG